MDSSRKAPIRLSNDTLTSLGDDILVPTYDRSTLTPGIVHIGLGNFHRAHLSWYLHRLMQMGEAQDWAIIGAGVRPADETQRRKLIAQDCLTTLISLEPDTIAVEIVGSMIGYVPVQGNNAPLIAQIADPGIRIVSMTVTEGGYYQDPSQNKLDVAHPDILHDVGNPGAPRTAFGAIIAALSIRRAKGLGPLTLLSCDNLPGNGTILREVVVSMARLIDEQLAEWIDTECSFPNSMVDCIVPATGAKELSLATAIGIDDRVPVTHEGFRQWVVEDDFCRGRPAWDLVGATFTAQVQDYEKLKLRILNGSHQIISNAGELLSLATIAECMADPHINAFFRKVVQEEIIPNVPELAGVSPVEYSALVEQRFLNPKIIDTPRRVSFDGSSRHVVYLHPTLRDGLAQGSRTSGLALAEALWARMCFGSREDGSEIEPNDPQWSDLQVAARQARSRPISWLEQKKIYGDLKDQPRFSDPFEYWLPRVWANGTRRAIEEYLAG